MSDADTPINTMMIIDDNDVDQYVYRRVVERSGLVENVLSFQLALDALDYLSERAGRGVDIILLDINMPGMDGFEFLEAATEKFGDDFSIVIVMLTSSLNPSDAERARSYPVVRDYLGKPLTQNHLDQIVELMGSL